MGDLNSSNKPIIRKLPIHTHQKSFTPVHSTIGKESSIWSFGQSERFRLTIKKLDSPRFVELPSTLDKRSTTFGLGNRSDLRTGIGRDSPPPGTYRIKTCFEHNRRAHSFGMRTKIVPDQLPNRDIPGPGAYNPPSPIGAEGPRFSFSPRRKFILRNSSPAPDAYSPSFSLVEKSKYKKITFGFGIRINTAKSISESPGPGAYDLPSTFKGNLKSKFQNILPRSSKTPLI